MSTTHPWAILNDPRNWQIIAPPYINEVKPSKSPRHKEWLKESTDRHEHVEIMVALEGTCLYSLDGKIYKTRPGTIMLCRPDIPHQCNYPPFTPTVKHLWITILNRQILARGLNIISGEIQRCEEEYILLDRDDILTPALDLTPFGAISEPAPANAEVHLYAALSTLFTHLLNTPFTADTASASFQERVIRSLQDHLRETAGRDASLDSLARISGYSKFHLHRLFKTHTGHTIQQWIDHCRHDHVRQRLGENASKKVIAAELGFSCPAAFSRWLKAHPLTP